ncbi:MAG: ATP-dependent DNA ligase [Thermoleophilaceae bacterium]
MALPIHPPLQPMLAKLSRELPRNGFLYEPKWDGFRCIAFVDGDDVDLRSRNDKPLARYFPELVAGLAAAASEAVVLDGEIVGAGDHDFDALMLRLHPAVSRVERLARESPAVFVAFDLLAVGDADLRGRPFAERRERLAEMLGHAGPPVHLTPATEDPRVAARWLERFVGGGIDGVVAKPRDAGYQPGVRAMVKVKQEQTADCVVAGFRSFVDGPPVGSLLLGLYDAGGQLQHVGVAASFAARRQPELAAALFPRVSPLAGHPWEHGFLLGGGAGGRLAGAAGRWSPDEMELDWFPVSPMPVCEVAYDQVDRGRFRHAARFRRWRPDRDPASCRLDQIEIEAPPPAEVLSLT